MGPDFLNGSSNFLFNFFWGKMARNLYFQKVQLFNVIRKKKKRQTWTHHSIALNFFQSNYKRHEFNLIKITDNRGYWPFIN